jgi:hypothetical protein
MTSEVLAEAAARAESRGDVDETEVREEGSAGAGVDPAGTRRSRVPATPSSDRRVVVIDDDIDIPVSTPPPQAPQGEPSTAGARVGATLEDERAPKKRWRLFRKGGD